MWKEEQREDGSGVIEEIARTQHDAGGDEESLHRIAVRVYVEC